MQEYTRKGIKQWLDHALNQLDREEARRMQQTRDDVVATMSARYVLRLLEETLDHVEN